METNTVPNYDMMIVAWENSVHPLICFICIRPLRSTFHDLLVKMWRSIKFIRTIHHKTKIVTISPYPPLFQWLHWKLFMILDTSSIIWKACVFKIFSSVLSSDWDLLKSHFGRSQLMKIKVNFEVCDIILAYCILSEHAIFNISMKIISFQFLLLALGPCKLFFI